MRVLLPASAPLDYTVHAQWRLDTAVQSPGKAQVSAGFSSCSCGTTASRRRSVDSDGK